MLYVCKSMQHIPDDLDGAKALNVCRTPDGWQASLERSQGSFAIGHGATPDAAVRDAFRLPAPLPPVPPL